MPINHLKEFNLYMDLLLMHVPKIKEYENGFITKEELILLDDIHRQYLNIMKSIYNRNATSSSNIIRENQGIKTINNQ